MASSVTAPLERQFGQVPGLKQMTSTSSDGSSVITLQFALELNIDVAEQEVQAAINAAAHFPAARSAEPADLQQDQSGRRADPDAGADLRHAAARRRCRTWPTRGWRRRSRSCRAWGWCQHQRRPEAGRAHPGQSHRARRRYGLSLEDLRTALAQANVNQAKGSFDGAAPGVHDRRQRSAAVERASTASSIVAYRNGAPVRLSDVADVVDGVENVQAGGLDERRRRR